MSKRTELSKYMQALTPSISPINASHLAQPELMAYLRTELSPAEHTQAQTHLLSCEQCLTEFRDLHDFYAPAQEDETALSEFEAKRIWRSLQTAIKTEAKPSAVPITTNWRLPLAAAACLLIALIPLGFLTYQLKHNNQELTVKLERVEQEKRQLSDQLAESNMQVAQIQAQTNETHLTVEKLQRQISELNKPVTPQVLDSYELPPQSMVQRSSSSNQTRVIAFTQARQFVLLNLIFEKIEQNKRYDLELYNTNKPSLLWQEKGVKPNAIDSFTIRLHEGFLPAGSYRIKVFRSDTPHQTPVEEFTFTVKSPSSSKQP